MAFDPPGPQSNPTTRDFLWGQEVVGPFFQYREAESPRCGKEGRDAGEAGEGLGHASACGAQQGRGRRQLFCPPTRPACTIPHTSSGGVATALPLPASCAQELRAPSG